MAGVKNTVRAVAAKVDTLAYRIRNLLTRKTPVQVVITGPDDRLVTALTEQISAWYHPSQVVTVWGPAVAAERLRARVIVSSDPDDAARFERITRRLSPTRRLVVVLAVADPLTLVSEASKQLPGHFAQGANYRLTVDGKTRSRTRPGVVDRTWDALGLIKNAPEVSLLVRREDAIVTPDETAAKISRAIQSAGGPKTLVSPRLALDSLTSNSGRDSQRVIQQREQFPELDALREPLGYPPESSVSSAALTAPRGLIVAFHTPDEIYTREAERLKKSLDALGLEYSISVVEPEANWVRTTLLKPTWIRPARESVRGPLLYVDVDAFVHKDPWPHVADLDADMAAVVYTNGELNSATLWINDTPGASQLLDLWATWSTDRRAKDGGSLRQIGDDSDQGVLRHLVEAEESHDAPRFHFARLSPNMASIFDRLDDYRYGPIVIEQLQASREITQREKRLARRRDRLAQLGE